MLTSAGFIQVNETLLFSLIWDWCIVLTAIDFKNHGCTDLRARRQRDAAKKDAVPALDIVLKETHIHFTP